MHTPARSFKENLFRCHSSVMATTFTGTSDQFFSCRRSRPNQTPNILRGPSFELKGPGRALPFHEPRRKPLLILDPVTTSYLPISLLTSTTSTQLVISTLTSSAYAVYVEATEVPGNTRPRRTRFTFNQHKHV